MASQTAEIGAQVTDNVHSLKVQRQESPLKIRKNSSDSFIKRATLIQQRNAKVTSNIRKVRSVSQIISNSSNILGRTVENNEKVLSADLAKQVFFISGEVGNLTTQCDYKWVKNNRQKLEKASKLATAAGNLVHCQSVFRKFSIPNLVAQESRNIHERASHQESRNIHEGTSSSGISNAHLAREAFDKALEIINQARDIKYRLDDEEIVSELPEAISSLLQNNFEICPITRKIILYTSIVEDPSFGQNSPRRWRHYDKYALERAFRAHQTPPRWPVSVNFASSSINRAVSDYNTNKALRHFIAKLNEIIQEQENIMLAMQSLVV